MSFSKFQAPSVAVANVERDGWVGFLELVSLASERKAGVS